MELYGGGMARKSNNYQLGGRIAQFKRDSDFQREGRNIDFLSNLASSRMRKAINAENLASLAGGAIGAALGGVPGAAIGAALTRGLVGKAAYKDTDFGMEEGKYRKGQRRKLSQMEEGFKGGLGERALVSGLQAAVMPGIYEKAGSWLKGLGGAGEAATTAAQAADIAGTAPEFAAGFGTSPVHEGMAASGLKLSGPPQLGATPSMSMPGGLGSGMASKLSAMPSTAVAAATEGIGAYTGTAAQNLAMAKKLGLDLSGGQTVRGAFEAGGYGPWGTNASEWFSSLFPGSGVQLAGMRGGGMIPEMQMGGMIGEDPSMLEPPLPTPPRPMRPIERPARQAEPIAPTMGASPMMASAPPPPPSPTVGASPISATQPPPPPAQTMGASPMGETANDFSGVDAAGIKALADSGGIFGGKPVFGEDTDWSMSGSDLFGFNKATEAAGAQGAAPSGQYSGYGTAIGAESALRQMGMGDIADDPRFKEYLEDLPQFSQGYRQKFGDIMAGGREAARQAYAAQRLGGAGGGFAGAGASPQAFQQGMAGLKSDIGRQRRGVVEGFQSDLLSALGDIEDKGQFEFGKESYDDITSSIGKLKQRPGLEGEVFRKMGDDKIREMFQYTGIG